MKESTSLAFPMEQIYDGTFYLLKITTLRIHGFLSLLAEYYMDFFANTRIIIINLF
jgi:hypothetical protein